MIRDVVRDYLIANVPSVGGRVYDKGGASDSNVKPYLVVVKGAGVNIATWDGYDGDLQVYIYGEETLFVEIDRVELEVIKALNHVVLRDPDNGHYFHFEFDRSPMPDQIDDLTLKAYDRLVVFRMYDFGWMNGLTYDPDPADLLNRLTTANFPEVGTDPNAWVVGNPTPAIYWRTARELSRDGFQNWGGAWVEVQMVGHVLAPSPTVREAYQRRMLEVLASFDDTLPFDATNEDLFHLVPPMDNNRNANPARQGQLRVNGRFVVWTNRDPAPPGPIVPPPGGPPGPAGPPPPKINEFDIEYDGLVEIVGQRTTP